jgi:hypothetical protein
MKFLAVVGLASLMTAGCCHLSMSRSGAPAAPLPEALAAQFSYPQTFDLASREEPVEQRSRYNIARIEIAALPDRFDTNRVVTLDYYSPHGQGKKPVVVVVPISGGGYELERFSSAYFAKRGWAAVIVRRRRLAREPVNGEELSAVFRESVNDVRRAIDWIETRPELDATKVGVFGVSLGGIRASIIGPVDSRVQAAVLGLAGGDVPYILLHTADRGIVRRRKAMLKESGLTRQALEERFRTGFECDPNTFAPYMPRDRVLLVLACCDRAVPIKKGRELREKMGRPETIFLPTGHYTALFYLPYLHHESFQFLRDRFEGKPPRRAPDATAQMPR